MKFFNKSMLSALLLFHACAHAQENQHDLEEKKFWGIPEAFSLSPSELAKILIKEVYSVNPPSSFVKVQTSSELCPEERQFLNNRLPLVQQSLQNSFNIQEPLKMGFCLSGGGNRAMVGSLGFLQAAAKANILDSSLYLAALSGSTWLTSQLCYLAATTHRNKSFNEILTEIKEDYKNRISNYSGLGVSGIYGPPLLSFDSTDDFLIEMAKRFGYEQEITLVNFFGCLVSDYALGLMGHDRLSEKWSAISREITYGKVPLPINASTFEDPNKQVHEWFELSPLQCGSKEMGYIPVEYLGSEFENGDLNIKKLCYEYPISFFLGMHGSAFAITVKEIIDMQKSMKKKVTLFSDDALEQIKRRGIMDNSFVQGFIQNHIQDVLNSRNALTYAHFPNYSEGMVTSLLKDRASFGMFDAGIDINMPIPTLLDRQERNLDIVFIYDSNPGESNEFDEITAYCKRKGIPFPQLEQGLIDNCQYEEMTVFNDPRKDNYVSELSTYIYFPSNHIDVKSPPYITFNFKYSEEEIDYLASSVESIFLSHLDDITLIMNLVAQKKYQ